MSSGPGRARTCSPRSDDTELHPEDEAVRKAEAAVVNVALGRLPQTDREILLEHEVEGRDTATLAAGRGTTPGAVAARLARTRARLRVEYLLAQCGAEPPTDQCRPVLLALSAADRRRQAELDVIGHLLACDFCADVSSRLLSSAVRAGAGRGGAGAGVARRRRRRRAAEGS